MRGQHSKVAAGIETQPRPVGHLGIPGRGVHSMFEIQAETLSKESETSNQARIDRRPQ